MFIIETNFLKEEDDIKDVQSRIVEIDTLENYIEQFYNHKNGLTMEEYRGSLHGSSLRKSNRIISIEHDNMKIIVHLVSNFGTKSVLAGYRAHLERIFEWKQQ